MLDAAFQYDYAKNEWAQCTQPAYVQKDIEKLPHTLIVAYQNETAKDISALRHYVCCPLHHKMEEVKDADREHLVTVDGCVFGGLMALGVFPDQNSYHARSKILYVPFRWRIFQRNANEPINIACDVAEVQRGRVWIHQNRYWRTFSIAANISTRKLLIATLKESYRLAARPWTEIVDLEIPDIVVDTAIDALRESVRYKFGIKPSVLSQMKGHAKITAFIERPFDLNIVYLKNFLQRFIQKDFDQVFPYEQKDNYREICRLLEIQPPKSLRKAYACNPYAIVWYMIFRQWNIKDINLMRPFFALDFSITSLYLHKFYFNTQSNRVERKWNEAQTEWNALEHYASWLIGQKGEKFFLNWLYRMSTEKILTRLEWDILIPFHQYYAKLSAEVKKLLLRDGLTPYVHDAISWEVARLSENGKNIQLMYEDDILAYECSINGYEFHLAHETRDLHLFGMALKNCVASYFSRVVGYTSIIVAVRHAGKYAACIELQKGCHIVQALGVYNERLNGELLLACRSWAKLKKLAVDVNHLDLPLESNLQDWTTATVEELPYQKAIAEMNAEELLAMPKDTIHRNYYLFLEEALIKHCRKTISAPPWKQFSDEKAYLMYVFPQGERIYEAAFAGNAEARRALGLLYFMGKTFPQDLDKARTWLMAAATAGDKKAALEATRLKIAAENGDIEMNYKILIALRRLRNQMEHAAEKEDREAG